MESLASSILYNCHFKGCFHVDKLPDFSSYPASYLIYVDPLVYFAVIRYSEEELVVFNPASRLIAYPPELIEELSYFCDVTLLDLNINFLVKHMFGTCIFFIFHCINNINKLFITFPKESSYIEHMYNIKDFLKVKNPSHFNSW